MQDLEPPEVPLELVPQTAAQEPKKRGFFRNLFSKKDQVKESSTESMPNLPDMDAPKIDLPTLEVPPTDMDVNNYKENSSDLPTLTEQLEELKTDLNMIESGKIKNKSHGKLKKGQKKKIGKIDESSQLDWTREIQEQEILIHDSNRFNQDVNLLITQADQHIDDKTQAAADDVFTSQHNDITPEFEPMNVQDVNTNIMQPMPQVSQQMPPIDEDQHMTFMKISSNHQKLRTTLERYLKNQKLFNNKAKVIELFKLYDDSVEKNIEDKEMELTNMKRNLERYEKHLKDQEKSIKNMHSYMSKLDKKLKNREKNINEIIAGTVETELARRLKIDKKSLKAELSRTVALNNDLKKKVKIIGEDRIRFENERQKMSEMERKKLTELQLIYERKLKDLDIEKKDFDEKKRIFEERKKVSLELIKVADSVSKDLYEVKKLKSDIDVNKKTVERELSEDKELKDAISKAEVSLAHEKENLDKMIFSKYIENKLKSIKPEYLEKRQDWKVALKSNPLYEQMSQCRKLLMQRNLVDAKKQYNDIRKAYEQVNAPRKEKEALYTAIRELYNDIQLKIVESQMHTR
jgi:hypothetical protein